METAVLDQELVGEGFAFFCWHRYTWPDVECNGQQACREVWKRRNDNEPLALSTAHVG